MSYSSGVDVLGDGTTATPLEEVHNEVVPPVPVQIVREKTPPWQIGLMLVGAISSLANLFELSLWRKLKKAKARR